jgi:hypothetical protein
VDGKKNGKDKNDPYPRPGVSARGGRKESSGSVPLTTVLRGSPLLPVGFILASVFVIVVVGWKVGERERKVGGAGGGEGLYLE